MKHTQNIGLYPCVAMYIQRIPNIMLKIYSKFAQHWPISINAENQHWNNVIPLIGATLAQHWSNECSYNDPTVLPMLLLIVHAVNYVVHIVPQKTYQMNCILFDIDAYFITKYMYMHIALLVFFVNKLIFISILQMFIQSAKYHRLWS